MHKIKYRVYYEDTDAGGIVYYANYLRFAERARTDWLRDLGFDQSKMDILFVVKKVEIEYHSPAKLDDEVLVETCVANMGKASMLMSQKFFVGDRNLATAEVLIVCIDENFKPKAISEEIKKSLQL